MPHVIRVNGLGKRYRMGAREAYGTLRDTITRSVRGVLGRGGARSASTEAQWIWALRDVSFEVGDGEILGIIGRNGSGKSTLLKILSRITEPTAGYAEVRGRVGSLLEVGTGFHPELTGRENVFVNGAILGMRGREIERRFDEIVAFAEVEAFIDTAVKHYSSGMQMRLAFAVAAHLQPNILLVDEVLAVGDIEFQRRCLGKMKDVSREGRTVILVSHQMGQIRRLCQTGLWLDRGRVQHVGDVGATISHYESAILRGDDGAAGQCFSQWELAEGGHVVRAGDRPVTFRVRVTLAEPVAAGHYGVGLLDEQDAVVAGWAFEPVALPVGTHTLDVRIPMLPIRPGTYRVSFALFNRGSNLTGGRLVEKWVATPALTLDVPPLGHPQDEWSGLLNVPATLSGLPSGDRVRTDSYLATVSAAPRVAASS
jgi:ABC-type polysaccharide/polyol phosphate transport system ATPase subunit